MNIVFWSNSSGRSATSGNMLAVSVMSSVFYSIKTLLLQMDRESRALDDVFEGRKEESLVNDEFSFYNKKGFDQVLENTRLSILNEAIIESNIINIKHTNIHYMPISKKSHEGIDEEEKINIVSKIADQLNTMDKINFWDIENGNDNISKKMLQKADVVVVNRAQEIILNDKTIEDEEILKKSVFLIGRYDNTSKVNVNVIRKKYGISKENIATIPYSIGFHDAIYEGKVVPFLMKNIFSKKQDDNFEFINGVYNATNLVLRKAGIDGI